MLVHWRPDRPVTSLSSIALRYSLVCIGCCWPLMAVTLLVGSLLLPVMVIVSLLMLCERLLPSVRKLIPIQAGFAFALAVFLFADLGPNLGSNPGDTASPLAPDPGSPHHTHDHVHHHHGQAR
jgi:predicted metal-binding membrane protein